MADRNIWPAAQPPPPGWLPAGADHPPVLPPGQPPRPVYREPHPIRTAPVLSGMGAALIWFAAFGFLAGDLLSYAWWTVLAAVTAWAVALVLTKLGDRGVATGVAIVAGLGLSIAMGFVTHRWVATLDWPLW
ncbi:hypothetical protein [Actinoplanes sp. NPDC049265]|uniref:hypothetical protein n=1 Tax=Actinoplanes sp. NPDC049265 TaxID=3363902 RepID=UPI0037108AF7